MYLINEHDQREICNGRRKDPPNHQYTVYLKQHNTCFPLSQRASTVFSNKSKFSQHLILSNILNFFLPRVMKATSQNYTVFRFNYKRNYMQNILFLKYGVCLIRWIDRSYSPDSTRDIQRLVLSVDWLLLFININKSGKALTSLISMTSFHSHVVIGIYE